VITALDPPGPPIGVVTGVRPVVDRAAERSGAEAQRVGAPQYFDVSCGERLDRLEVEAAVTLGPTTLP
jgi:hypothetical protein